MTFKKVNLNNLTDVNTAGADIGDALIYSSGGWVPGVVAASGEGTTDHAELLNLDYASAGHTGFSPSDHNHSGLYADIDHNHDEDYADIIHDHDETYAPIVHDHALEDLTDVGLDTPTSGEALVYDGELWGNTTLPAVVTAHNLLNNLDYASAGHTGFSPTAHNHDGVYAAIDHDHDEDYSAIDHTHALEDLTDVGLDTPASGEYLKYDGAEWINAELPSEVTYALDDLTDVSASSPDTGDFIYYVSGEWIKTQKAGEHTSANGATPQLANIVFGSGDPPEASSVPEGTIWIKYTDQEDK